MSILSVARRVPPITLATRFRLAREWAGLDQQGLADELGISRATVSNYETGKTRPNKMTINAWAVACNFVDRDWLRDGEIVEPNTPDGGGVSANFGTMDYHFGSSALTTAEIIPFPRELIAA